MSDDLATEWATVLRGLASLTTACEDLIGRGYEVSSVEVGGWGGPSIIINLNVPFGDGSLLLTASEWHDGGNTWEGQEYRTWEGLCMGVPVMAFERRPLRKVEVKA